MSDDQGNGLFPYFVWRGLEGQADANRDQGMSVVEMTLYLSRTVKEASKESQELLRRSFVADFPLTKVGVR